MSTRCPPHMTSVWVRDEDYPSNSNLGMWLLRRCLCEWCGPDQADRQYCPSCAKPYAELVWRQEDEAQR